MSRAIRSKSTVTIVFSLALALAACGAEDAAPDAHSGAEGGAARVSSSAGLPAGRITAGEELAASKGKATGQSCIDCHGADGNTPLDPTYPKLGGQYADYLEHALQGYRDGKRSHALMSQQAKDLDDQQIADLAAYFASRPSQLRDLEGVH
ncbi:cytochrome c [Luteimonas vadosa]|uniref:Cytochrome c n=1 Tax=Luteimonas vadosa TaxID=1165507 RepID=A0ABP9E2C9_9GAMM